MCLSWSWRKLFAKFTVHEINFFTEWRIKHSSKKCAHDCLLMITMQTVKIINIPHKYHWKNSASITNCVCVLNKMLSMLLDSGMKIATIAEKMLCYLIRTKFVKIIDIIGLFVHITPRPKEVFNFNLCQLLIFFFNSIRK